MSRSDFCNERAQRMKTLAEDSADPDVRVHLTKMAKNWMRQAKANENEKTRTTRPTRQICPGSGKKRGLDSVQTAEPLKHSRGKTAAPSNSRE
jgi:hypothetical protein